MPCEESGPIKWLFHKASEYGALPPTLNSVACPLKDGDCTPWFIQKEIPSQGDGEQVHKVWRSLSELTPPAAALQTGIELPAFCPLVGVAGGAGVGEVGVGGADAEALATVICSGCFLDIPFESKTETVKLKLPLAAGVPEIVPVWLPRSTPPGG
jgi:hypothetical protein